MLWIDAILLWDKSSWQSVSAAMFVSEVTGIFISKLCDKSNLETRALISINTFTAFEYGTNQQISDWNKSIFVLPPFLIFV